MVSICFSCHAAFSGFTSCSKNLDKQSNDSVRFLMTQNANLHVVDEQVESLWIAHLFRRLRYAQPVCAFHV